MPYRNVRKPITATLADPTQIGPIDRKNGRCIILRTGRGDTMLSGEEAIALSRELNERAKEIEVNNNK
jgi:hypothetical protein